MRHSDQQLRKEVKGGKKKGGEGRKGREGREGRGEGRNKT
jgi:hypothetical protein